MSGLAFTSTFCPSVSVSNALRYNGSNTCPSVAKGSLRSAAAATLNVIGTGAGPSRSATTMGYSQDQEKDSTEEETKLFIGNLSWNTTDASLSKAFDTFGNLVDVRVIVDRFTGRSRGFGFIEYDAADAANDALEAMNGADVDGREIRVDRARSKNKNIRERSDNFYN